MKVWCLLVEAPNFINDLRMVTIDNKDKDYMIGKLMWSAKYWNGLRILSRKNFSFSWPDGRILTGYTSWGPNKLLKDNVPCYAVMNSYGKWYDTSCVFCEKIHLQEEHLPRRLR